MTKSKKTATDKAATTEAIATYPGPDGAELRGHGVGFDTSLYGIPNGEDAQQFIGQTVAEAYGSAGVSADEWNEADDETRESYINQVIEGRAKSGDQEDLTAVTISDLEGRVNDMDRDQVQSALDAENAADNPRVGAVDLYEARLSALDDDAEEEEGNNEDPDTYPLKPDLENGKAAFIPEPNLAARFTPATPQEEVIDYVVGVCTELATNGQTAAGPQTNLIDDLGYGEKELLALRERIQSDVPNATHITPSEAMNWLLVRDVYNLLDRKLG